jgi:hypothetical protein
LASRSVPTWNRIIAWLKEMETFRYNATLRPENLRETIFQQI